MACSVNCSKCPTTHVFNRLGEDARWSAVCYKCKEIVMAPIPEGYKYVEGRCNEMTKIYRLKETSGWFTCKCCNFEYTIDLKGFKMMGKEKVFSSERTALLCKRKREELKNLQDSLKEADKPNVAMDELEREVKELEKKLEQMVQENIKLAEEFSMNTADDRLEKAEATRKIYLQQIEALHSETGDGEMSEYEKKMLAQLTLDLLQLKASLEQNTKLNEERVKEYAHFCSEITNLSAEDEFLLIEIDQLEVYVDEIRGQLNKISDEYKTILRTGDISMVTAEYDERLKQKGQENATLATRLEKIIGEITELYNELEKIKKETDEKWETIFDLVKKEEAEQKAAEEKRMENCQQRLLNVTLESEEN